MKKVCGWLLIVAAILVILAGYIHEYGLIAILCAIGSTAILFVIVVVGLYLISSDKGDK